MPGVDRARIVNFRGHRSPSFACDLRLRGEILQSQLSWRGVFLSETAGYRLRSSGGSMSGAGETMVGWKFELRCSGRWSSEPVPLNGH